MHPIVVRLKLDSWWSDIGAKLHAVSSACQQGKNTVTTWMHPRWSLWCLSIFVMASEQVRHCVIVSPSTNCCLQVLLKPSHLVVVRIRRSSGILNVFFSSGTSNARISHFFLFRSLKTSIWSLPRISWLLLCFTCTAILFQQPNRLRTEIL